jgi:hypothetical protein
LSRYPKKDSYQTAVEEATQPETEAQEPEVGTTPTVDSVPTTLLTDLFTQLAKMHAQMLKTVVEEIRRGPIDPIKEKQKERAHAEKNRAETAFWEQVKNREANCSHAREDLTSCIAWMPNSDGHIRGTCQHCFTVFSPIREECISEEVWKKYKDLRKIPTQRGTAVVYIS